MAQEVATVEKALSPPPASSGHGGWWPIIREWITGAWQTNLEVRVEDTLCYWALFRSVALVSSDVAKLRLKLMKTVSGSVPEEQPTPPILLNPNHFQNHIQFTETWVGSKLTRGNTYVLKQRDESKKVVGLYVLDPLRCRPMIADDGSIFYELQADNISKIGRAILVPASEIIHDRWNCFYHPLVGLSPIHAAGLSAMVGLRIQKNAENFFGNGSRPGGVLTAPGAIGNDTAARLKAHWDANFTGENVGKVAVLGDGLKYEQLSISAIDAQMLEQSKWTAEMVAGTFGVPSYMLNAGAMPNYNNVQALNQQYYSQSLQIIIEAVECCLLNGLEMTSGLFVEFDLDDLLRMDTATLIDTEAKAVEKGLKAPNEGRRRLGLPPKKGGDSPMMQQQQFSLEALAERDAGKPFAKPTPAPQAQGASMPTLEHLRAVTSKGWYLDA